VATGLGEDVLEVAVALVAVAGGVAGLISRVKGFAVPLTTSDILFSKTSPVVVLFVEPGKGGNDVDSSSNLGISTAVLHSLADN
jgi:hypothetical protein